MTTSGNVGKLMYALAEKRCENFGTCTADGSIKAINKEFVETEGSP